MKKILSLCLVLFLGFSSYTSALNLGDLKTLTWLRNWHHYSSGNHPISLHFSNNELICKASDFNFMPREHKTYPYTINFPLDPHFSCFNSSSSILISDSDHTYFQLYKFAVKNNELVPVIIDIETNGEVYLKNGKKTHTYKYLIGGRDNLGPILVSDVFSSKKPDIFTTFGGYEFFGIFVKIYDSKIDLYDLNHNRFYSYNLPEAETKNKYIREGGSGLPEYLSSVAPYKVYEVEYKGCSDVELSDCVEKNSGYADVFDYEDQQIRAYLGMKIKNVLENNIHSRITSNEEEGTDEDFIAYNACKGKFKGLEKYTLLSKSCFDDERRPPRVPPANGTGIRHGIHHNQITEPATDYQYPPSCNARIKFIKTEFSNRGEGWEDMQDESMVYMNNPSSLNLQNYCGSEPTKQVVETTNENDLYPFTSGVKKFLGIAGLPMEYLEKGIFSAVDYGLSFFPKKLGEKDGEEITTKDLNEDTQKLKELNQECEEAIGENKIHKCKELEDYKGLLVAKYGPLQKDGDVIGAKLGDVKNGKILIEENIFDKVIKYIKKDFKKGEDFLKERFGYNVSCIAPIGGSWDIIIYVIFVYLLFVLYSKFKS